MADCIDKVENSSETKNVSAASQTEILGVVVQKFVESKSEIYSFLLCGECLQIPPNKNYQYICEEGHIMCESCGYKAAACAFVYSKNVCNREISRVKITTAQQKLSNCFLRDDKPVKEVCEVAIPPPSVLVVPDTTTQPETMSTDDEVISKMVATNEIVTDNPPVKLDEKLSDDIPPITNITNAAIAETIVLPDNAPSTAMLQPANVSTEMETMEENETCDISPKSCSSSPKLESDDMQEIIDMKKAEEFPQKQKTLPAKFYHLKRLSKYFTKEELADVKEWMRKTCTNMTEAERTIVCRYRLHQVLDSKIRITI